MVRVDLSAAVNFIPNLKRCCIHCFCSCRSAPTISGARILPLIALANQEAHFLRRSGLMICDVALLYYIALTLVAHGPFWPCPTSNSTF
jgi:hypothetical protein